MQKGDSGKPNRDHRREEQQRIGAKELAHKSGQKDQRPAPGKGKPDPEEGVGGAQNQKR